MSDSTKASLSSANMGNIHIDPTGFVKLGAQLPTLANILAQAIDELGLTLSAQQQRSLLLYLDQLLLWNKAYNLTAITDPVEALIKHVIDCLAIITHLPSGSLLDIGTGAGLPAVIIAICQPERSCTALDSNQKKIRFIKQVSSELGLSNMQPIASRIEAHEASYDVITSRAFASLIDFVAVAEPRLADNGYLCAMKGKAPSEEELDALSNDWQFKTIKLNVPRLHDSRHLIELSYKNV
ncbi:16S rRNA (guanine(527)-N(7))-methyltransferase RsmG [Psychrobacter cryohalolentis]|jgi:16S rRNA (guanine527-N7)-methyltransferase|uniref:Ribosomal RNA small subunit methyltransferase G n=1 Tax=Psychrobacter cryohalolentis (strain ATCC BAA-1226 / DSM 17306 / VKM B-2378 / K5) TaxID=335284 RepID=RSMG_PSYCK|nr:16S rRNA (guanine(527)-N(7))-methyltransferase RsmG [Psychrobacter cryohalolentis]Q1QBW5.1 RecName: Full=Ribosomal RNA small subunit methyltransferase G; AltName: Full=16S rRNA 7-methylguanosine methyltransferase; Short=16S rRNA m7G methyltransferase [Psychrobacter cryohalolentis K5]ABE74838.1 16S rRNA m(7)G-527 methyltransferase [Psychrobacter cryohalolentis K5]ASE27446.1 ribosomal RNA small subunit methyltransferase G [Psychrobacter cryohalolentis]